MEYKIMGGHFDLEEHGLKDDEFEKATDNRAREQLYIPIAEGILAAENFQHVDRPDKVQSVPFDFIATKDQRLALIEMKGAKDGFNYSKDTQFARLFRVVEEPEVKKISPSLFLLQINLTYRVYQILTPEFYELVFREVREMIKRDPKKGAKQNIDSSLKDIDAYRRKYGS